MRPASWLIVLFVGAAIGFMLGRTQPRMPPEPPALSWLGRPPEVTRMDFPDARRRTPPPNVHDALEWYFLEAARTLQNCGRVHAGGANRSKVDRCVQDSLRTKTPFYARYDFAGIDSEVASGLLMSGDKRLLVVGFDSMGCGDPSCVRVVPCDAPRAASSREGLRITCINSYDLFQSYESVDESPTFHEDDLGASPASDISPPKLIHRVEPTYPEAAARAHLEGVVILELVVDKKGSVDQVRVLQDAPLFVHQAIAAVRQWKYEPARDRRGRALEVRLSVSVKFEIPKTPPSIRR